MKLHKSSTMLLIATMMAISTLAFATPTLAQQPPFSATINITGTTTIEVGQTTTLTATYTTNRDVTRFEWRIDDISQGVTNIPSGQGSAGSQTFDFSSNTAGTYVVSFRIWHHNPMQADRVASQSITITVIQPTVEYEYESAYAYGGDDANKFTDNGFSNWGWSNGPLSAGSYEFDLYAGAAQCDLTKGIKVGTVTVVYTGSSITVTFNVDSPYTLEETHVYADSGMFPLKNGNPTAAPGQYYVSSALSGSIYVIAHAVVGIPK